ncbi:hypothetical protein MMC28_007536 [Mycoblastus sanguinarius]|nr:hypothetical protein [Mycoblastus sanguinarius]
MGLTHPTAGEFETIYSLSFFAWGDTLSLPQYLEESAFLTTVPLARDDGMSVWMLTDKTLPQDQRPILCSCETFRKRAFVTDTKGQLTEMIIHGIASVFCNPIYRGRGYAARLMQELAIMLPRWQVGSGRCIGSVLYSDIGKTYYANLGWHPFPINNHIELDPMNAPMPPQAEKLLAKDLDQLCKDDEALIRKVMTSKSNGNIRMMLVPDIDHMLWHHAKEEFACEKIFGKQPQVKGAIAGPPGNRIWAIWTHRFYGDPESASSDNTLYILRVVVEDQNANAAQQETQAEQMQAVLKAAQIEAAEWKLHCVKVWDPAPTVREMLERAGIQHRKVTREEDGIASLLWYGEGNGKEDTLEWIGNEKYAWC